KPLEASPEKSHRRRPRQPAATSLLNDVRSPARRLTRANAHRLLSCESELRVRSCGFPPDLRVSGARQRILRPSTPVETSRPLDDSPLYGPAEGRSKDSPRWGSARSGAASDQMHGCGSDDRHHRRRWAETQIFIGEPRDERAQLESAV